MEFGARLNAGRQLFYRHFVCCAGRAVAVWQLGAGNAGVIGVRVRVFAPFFPFCYPYFEDAAAVFSKTLVVGFRTGISVAVNSANAARY